MRLIWEKKIFCTNMEPEFQVVQGVGNPISTPISSKKQISPSKCWCMTFNNYTDEELFQCADKFEYLCSKYIIAHEVGASGTPHLQMFAHFKKKLRPLSLHLSKSIHWAKTKGTDMDNFKYCSKDGEILYSKGFPKPVRILTDEELFPWQLKILEIIKDRKSHPNDREVIWAWEAQGAIGKTVFCKYLVKKLGAIVLNGKASDQRHGCAQCFLSKGDYPEIILINFPRSKNAEYFSYEALENLKDALFYSSKYEGAMIIGNCPIVIVFANEPPDTERLSGDRWNIINLRDWDA